MAKLIVPYTVGAVYLMIALFSVGVLQSIDCLEDEKLFNELNNEDWSLQVVENELDAVDNPEAVELAGVPLIKLKSLRDISKANCQLEDLEYAKSMVDVCFLKKNNGLIRYTTYHFYKKAMFCFSQLVQNIDAVVEVKMNDAEQGVAKKFWKTFDPKEFNLFKLLRVEISGLAGVITTNARSWLQRSPEKEVKDLQSSCTKLQNILEEHFPIETSKAYFYWLRDFTVKPLSWIEIGLVCNAYLSLLMDKQASIVYRDEHSRDEVRDKDLGFDFWTVKPIHNRT